MNQTPHETICLRILYLMSWYKPKQTPQYFHHLPLRGSETANQTQWFSLDQRQQQTRDGGPALHHLRIPRIQSVSLICSELKGKACRPEPGVTALQMCRGRGATERSSLSQSVSVCQEDLSDSGPEIKSSVWT